MHADRDMHCDAMMYHSRMKFLKSRAGTRNRGGAVERGWLVREPCKLETVLPPIELMTRPQSFRYACWKNNQANIKSRVRQLPNFLKKSDPAIENKHKEIFARIRAAEGALDRSKREKEAQKQATEKTADRPARRDSGQVASEQATGGKPDSVSDTVKLESPNHLPSLPPIGLKKEISGSLPLLHTTQMRRSEVTTESGKNKSYPDDLHPQKGTRRRDGIRR